MRHRPYAHERACDPFASSWSRVRDSRLQCLVSSDELQRFGQFPLGRFVVHDSLEIFEACEDVMTVQVAILLRDSALVFRCAMPHGVGHSCKDVGGFLHSRLLLRGESQERILHHVEQSIGRECCGYRRVLVLRR